MALVVQKYGGTSLASPKHIQQAAQRITELKASGTQVVVVVSAMGHTTDHLLKLASKTVKSPPSRELDMLLTAGERVSMSLLAMCLQERNIPAISFTGSQSGIITTEAHTQAKILEIKPARISEELEKGKVVIIAGFQGVSRNKEITTLGRGGSDTTAVALAAVLKADRCEILTDVRGIYSADPRLVPKAKLFSYLSYEKCLQLSVLGAKMHPRSIELAKRFQVPLLIGSSQSREEKGTEVGPGEKEEKKMENSKVSSVVSKDGFKVFSVSQELYRVAQFFCQKETPLDLFSSSQEETHFVCPESISSDFQKEFPDSFNLFGPVSIVSLVGEGFSHAPHVLSRMLEVLKNCGVEPLLTSAGSGAFSVAILSSEKVKAIQALHLEFVAD